MPLSRHYEKSRHNWRFCFCSFVVSVRTGTQGNVSNVRFLAPMSESPHFRTLKCVLFTIPVNVSVYYCCSFLLVSVWFFSGCCPLTCVRTYHFLSCRPPIQELLSFVIIPPGQNKDARPPSVPCALLSLPVCPLCIQRQPWPAMSP